MRWMREHARLLMVITVGLFIGGFIAPGILRYIFGIQLFGEARSRNVAVVNGEPIRMENFYDRFNELQRRRREKGGALTRDQLRDLRRETLKQLVEETLLGEILRAEGGRATPREIRQFFASQPPFRTEEGGIDQRRVSAALQRMSDRERTRMEESSRRQIESQRAMQWLRSAVDTTDSEVRAVMRLGLREARLHGLLLRPRRYVSDSEVRGYYRAHREDFMREPRVKLRQIHLRPPDTPTRAGGLEEVRNTLETLRRRFQAGEDFARLARAYSDDPASARRGGLRGWVTPGDLEDPIARAAFNLSPGELSNLVKTDRGYYLLYLDSGPVRRPRPLSEVRGTIQGRLVSGVHWEEARRRARQLKREIAGAPSPLNRLQELAVLRSHSEATAGRGGDYGWVPYRFVMPDVHAAAGRWQDELTQGRFVDDAVSRALFSDRTDTVLGPVRSGGGIHLFYVSDYRPPRLNELSDSDVRQLAQVIGFEKQNAYVETWLDVRRRRAEVQIEASPDVVGGPVPWADVSS